MPKKNDICHSSANCYNLATLLGIYRLNLGTHKSLSSEIVRRIGAKKKPGNHHEQQRMNNQIARDMNAQDYVKSSPGDCEPSRPILSSQHECSRDDRQKLDQFCQNTVARSGQQLGKTDSELDRANQNEEARDD
jgi:hypothetical protein